MRLSLKWPTGLLAALLMAVMMPQSAFADFLYSSLKDGISIRALSMGGTLTAISKGPESTFYNPAGFATPGGFYQYESYDNNRIRYPEFTAHMFALGPFGISQFRKQDMNGNSTQINAYSYGRRGTKGTDWGVTLKSVSSSGTVNAQGWTGDVGVLAHFNRNIQIGLLAQDVYKSGITIPTTVRLGFAFLSDSQDLILASDLVYEPNPNGGTQYVITPHYGAELNVSEGLILRGGWSQSKLSYGFNFALAVLNIDFGVITSPGETLYMLGFKLGGMGSPAGATPRQETLFKG